MRFAILCNLESWYLKDLQRAAAGQHELTPIAFRQLCGGLESGMATVSAGFDLSPFDAILVRTMSAGSLEQVVFRMDVLGRLEAAGKPFKVVMTACMRKLLVILNTLAKNNCHWNPKLTPQHS